MSDLRGVLRRADHGEGCGRALVIAGHLDAVSGESVAQPEADLVVAADGGLDTAVRLGWRVDAVVGDLDSAGAAALEWARARRVEIVARPGRKDETDLELALELACGRAAAVHVLASARGRLDHALANLLVLASPRWARAEVSATVGQAHVDVVRGRRRLAGGVGDVVSLIAVGGPARVARTWGLDFPLADDTLDAAEARGVSNVIVSDPAVVDVSEGVLLAVRPGAVRV